MVPTKNNNHGMEKQKGDISIFRKSHFLLALVESVGRSLLVQETAAVGAAVGAACGGLFTQRLGKRTSLLLAYLLIFVVTILMGVAPNPVVLIVGRLLVGFCVGAVSKSSPLYISEISPPKLRGALCSAKPILVAGGSFFSYVINSAFTTGTWRWIWMVGVAEALQFILVIFMPESPRCLCRKISYRFIISTLFEREEEARAVLNKIYPDDQEAEAQARALRQSVENENEQRNRFQYADLWNNKEIRFALMAGGGIQIFQRTVGLNILKNYSTAIVQFAGFTSHSTSPIISMITSGWNLVYSGISFFVLGKTRTRNLIICSLLGTIVSLALLGVLFHFTSASVSRTTLQFPRNSTCPGYSSHTTTWDCMKCVSVNPQCGFCSSKEKQVSVGACLISNPTTQGLCHAKYGQWFSGGCPSEYGWVGWLALLGLGLYIFFYAPGMGTIPWIFNSEIYPPNYHSVYGGMAGAINWIAILMVDETFVPMTKSMGLSMSFITFTICALLGFVFVVIMLRKSKRVLMEQLSDGGDVNKTI